MKTRAGSALHHALALLRSPRSARPGADDRLPNDMLLLFRIVAGEEQALSLAQEITRESPEALREAASFYIQQVMFAGDSNSYRVLGVDPDVTDERLREHYRWLARWLHPDRNPDKWEAVYAERVNQAWQDVRTPERRQSYDESRNESAVRDDEPKAPVANLRRTAYLEPSSPGLNLRWLPTAIFSGLGVSAILIVSLFYVLRWAEPESNDPSSSPPDPASVADVALAPVSPAMVPEIQPAQDLSAAAISADDQVGGEIPTAVDENSLARSVATISAASADTSAASNSPALAVDQPLSAARVSPLAETGPVLAEAPRPVKPSSPLLSATAQKPVREPRGTAHTQTTSAEGSEAAKPRLASTRSARSEPRVENVAKTQPAVPEPAQSVASSKVVATPVSDLSRAPISEREANRLLGHFSKAYADGSLPGMRAIFTSDIRGPRGGLDTILAEYDKLFSGSQERTLAVRDVSVFADGATLTIIASYQATVTTGRSRRPRRTHGDLRLDLRREDEQWRIYRLQHDERPG